MKKLLENFLELRKHPSCIILSVIGLIDIVSIIMWIIANSDANTTPVIISFYLFLGYITTRIHFLPIYMSIIVILFIIEKIFNINVNNNFIKDNKLYKKIWLTGFIGMIIESFIIIPYLMPSITAMEGFPK